MQDSLLSKLFLARILTSTVFSYLKLSWGDFLNPDVLSSILSIQISASFAAPIINFMDIYGLTMRHVVSRIFPAADQMESNQKYFMGASWMLAERYTSFSKIIFVSLLYALLTPSGLFIAAAACAFTFFLDRFLLLRRWTKAPMMDASLAARVSGSLSYYQIIVVAALRNSPPIFFLPTCLSFLPSQFRQQVLFAISCHMYLSMIFIYGWPFDNTEVVATDASGVATYAKVTKEPPTLLTSMTREPWQPPGTRQWILPYKITTYIIILITLYVLVGNRIVFAIRQAFFSQDDTIGDATRYCMCWASLFLARPRPLSHPPIYIVLCYPTLAAGSPTLWWRESTPTARWWP